MQELAGPPCTGRRPRGGATSASCCQRLRRGARNEATTDDASVGKESKRPQGLDGDDIRVCVCALCFVLFCVVLKGHQKEALLVLPGPLKEEKAIFVATSGGQLFMPTCFCKAKNMQHSGGNGLRSPRLKSRDFVLAI